MGKHYKKRRRESSSSDNEEYYLRKKLLRLQNRLSKLDERNSASDFTSRSREVRSQRSLSPIAGSSKMQDDSLYSEVSERDHLGDEVSRNEDSTIQGKENKI